MHRPNLPQYDYEHNIIREDDADEEEQDSNPEPEFKPIINDPIDPRLEYELSQDRYIPRRFLH